MQQTALSASGLRVRAGGVDILNDVGLDLRRGEVVGLLGPNGSGKSTLLRVLAGLRAPDAGTVVLNGRDLAAIERRRVAATIGYLPQNAGSEWPLTVRETVALGRTPFLSPLARAGADDRRAVAAAMRAGDVDLLAHRNVTTLSGGERMRVMLARVLAGTPELLLLDEPITGLDARHQLEAMMLMRRLAGQGAGVLVVLHDLTLAARFCDRLQILRAGRTVAQGPAGAALTPEAVESAFDVRTRVFRHQTDTVTLPWTPVRRERSNHGAYI